MRKDAVLPFGLGAQCLDRYQFVGGMARGKSIALVHLLYNCACAFQEGTAYERIGLGSI